MMTWNARRRGAILRLAVLSVLMSGVMAIGAGRARADSQIASFSAATSTQAAGAHPDLTVALGVATTPYPPSGDGISHPAPDEYLQSVAVDLPSGLLAYAASTPTCGEALIENLQANDCPLGSQVGTVTIDEASPYATDSSGNPAPTYVLEEPIINQAPLPGEAARFAIPIGFGVVVVHIDVTVRDQSDYGVQATVNDLSTGIGIDGMNLDFWGVPSSPAHDLERLPCYSGYDFSACTGPVPLTGPATFLTNPTSCPGTALPVTAAATFYGDPTTYQASSDLPPTTGCASLPFAPNLSLTGASGTVGQPDAFTANLTVPQDDPDDTSGNTTSAVQGVTVKLPSGVALSPSVAGGLGACSDAQFGFGVHGVPSCPLDSQIATATVNTPLLNAPLTGEVFVGQQESSDPTSGNMYRLFLAADGSGVDLKLIGNVAANPSTGQLTATFPNDPQVQFSSLVLAFKGGPRAPLVNPYTCGTATSNWSITPYSNPGGPVTGSSSYPVTGNCALASQFTPQLTAGTASGTAGASSPFSFTLTRPDGQEVISGISNVTLPLGLNADIASVALCGSGPAASGRCGPISQVGTASIAAGPGSEPFNLNDQPVYLTGPYEGAPFGLEEVIHAIAGPYDLGTVIVRQAISVNPTTAQVSIHSDPLPVILGGVPLDVQSISLNLNRPGFMRSPTSCAAQSILATVQGSTPGAAANVAPGTFTGYAASTQSTAQLSEPFEASDCGALPFSPRLGIVLSGRGRTRPGSHPTLTATVTQPAGQANLHHVAVTLPLSLALDPQNSEHVCSVADAARIACPATTLVGRATANTPILPHPLAGDVYLVQGVRKGPGGAIIRTLPTLLIPLRGADGVDINLTAKTSINGREQLVTTFGSIPDAAISRFVLQISGGRKGILVVTGSRDLCRTSPHGSAEEVGQNGAARYVGVTLDRTACRR